MQSAIYIAQISDTHLFGDRNRKINGSNSYVNLRMVLNQIQHLSQKPNLIVVTGDLSQDCTFESYQHLANLLNDTNIKYYLLPGNHDDVNVLNRVFDYNWVQDNIDYFFDFSNWFFYVIDTSHYPEDGGRLSNKQFTNFDKSLNENKNKPTIVFMHHHPLEINSLWMDKMILKEKNEFNQIIKRNPEVKAVLFGHIHQVFEKLINSTFYGSAPSTSFQVLPNCEMFALERLAPGYRLIELEGNKFSSRVVRVE